MREKEEGRQMVVVEGGWDGMEFSEEKDAKNGQIDPKRERKRLEFLPRLFAQRRSLVPDFLFPLKRCLGCMSKT
jgi:hypothetical protein